MTLDFLETRSDIDSEKLAYLRYIWGAWTAPIIHAVEERFKASIGVNGGLRNRGLPEANPINFVTRAKTPILMLSGKYDMAFPLETSVKPMFDLLGTPQEHKALKLYETDHFVPINEHIKETLAWLDKYRGRLTGDGWRTHSHEGIHQSVGFRFQDSYFDPVIGGFETRPGDHSFLLLM